MSTHDEVDPQDFLNTSKAAQRERELPLLFLSIMLGLWVTTWCGVYLLV